MLYMLHHFTAGLPCRLLWLLSLQNVPLRAQVLPAQVPAPPLPGISSTWYAVPPPTNLAVWQFPVTTPVHGQTIFAVQRDVNWHGQLTQVVSTGKCNAIALTMSFRAGNKARQLLADPHIPSPTAPPLVRRSQYRKRGTASDPDTIVTWSCSWSTPEAYPISEAATVPSAYCDFTETAGFYVHADATNQKGELPFYSTNVAKNAGPFSLQAAALLNPVAVYDGLTKAGAAINTASLLSEIQADGYTVNTAQGNGDWLDRLMARIKTEEAKPATHRFTVGQLAGIITGSILAAVSLGWLIYGLYRLNRKRKYGY